MINPVRREGFNIAQDRSPFKGPSKYTSLPGKRLRASPQASLLTLLPHKEFTSHLVALARISVSSLPRADGLSPGLFACSKLQASSIKPTSKIHLR
ncbi:hypothetical protein B0H13DRAFT_2300975 [Mycena leptocephala]|nr:hypothetical protein B0H13DRAFT_2300975 [Mycena leptocephala]